jgi:hypothetical protein
MCAECDVDAKIMRLGNSVRILKPKTIWRTVLCTNLNILQAVPVDALEEVVGLDFLRSRHPCPEPLARVVTQKLWTKSNKSLLSCHPYREQKLFCCSYNV